ncbi:hypothetical protein MSG28_015731 [Choristoneura fumiferana]|uniref:Uncharacterized protein n=1 Tax=Choristoneura fumiferana TaxID=7141 RepID=A0ACC0KBB2_CHOFU|nr:hypothetical protein MSG28_015731 [Choristoneura fumiferana]
MANEQVGLLMIKGAIADDLEEKPADILTSLSAEITKSDVEITVGGKIDEDVATDSIEANDDSMNDKIPENLTQRKPEQESAGVNSAEDMQKITHTSDDNASFIHVKEKIARQSSGEEYDEPDEQHRDGNSDDLKDEGEPKQASDDLKNVEERVPSEVTDSESLDKKDEEFSEKSGSVGADDTQDLLKFDADDVDEDLPTQSRRMLSFDPKLLDAMNIPKAIEPELLLEPRSGQNDYKFNSPGINDNDRRHHELHDGESDPEVILAEESQKKPCGRFARGECQFGSICRFSHYTREQIQQLQDYVASKQQSITAHTQPSFEDLYKKLQTEKSAKPSKSDSNTVIYDKNGLTYVFPWTYNVQYESYDNLPPSVKKIRIEDFYNAEENEWG